MPVFTFKCPYCNNLRKRLFDTVAEADKPIKCELCYRIVERQYGAPTARVTEVLDNGSMVKRVERVQNAQEIYTERGHTPITR